jgi:5-methylcytosine-specific restriction endonuclease McrA
MPYQTNGKRDYKKEYDKYQGRPEQIARRAERVAARRQEAHLGLVFTGDGKDVDHITPLSKGGRNTLSNVRVVPAGTNRSFARNPDGSLKSQTSKRERVKK